MRYLLLSLTIAASITVLADMPRDYYPTTINGKQSAGLKTALFKTISNHTVVTDRNEIKKCIQNTDIRDDGSVWSMYVKPSNDTKVVDYLPVVPPLWYRDSAPYIMNCSFDMHQLTPAPADIYSHISTYPLGVVYDATVSDTGYNNGSLKVGMAQCEGVNITAYEPADEYKGDFARMCMYVATCYQTYDWSISGIYMFNYEDYPTLNNYSIDLLLSWHRKDPVSDKEIKRNNAIYSYQGNRNPFIDYPDLAEYLWGDKKDVQFYFPGESIIVPEEPKPEYSPLKSNYSVSHEPVKLYLPQVRGEVIWYIDGKMVNDGYLYPSQIGVGVHIIEYKGSACQGHVRIKITQ